MARLSILTLLAVSLATFCHAGVLGEQLSLQADDTPRTTEGWTYVDCGLASDPVQIESINVSPDPPKPGEDLTVTVKASVQEVVEEGAYADVTVKLGLIKLLQKQFDVCEEARGANATVQCPVQKGSYEVVQTVALPKEIPRAKFTVAVRGYTANEEELLCLDLKVDFMRHPFFDRLGL